MTYSVYQVDAFTTSIFKGNPACVVPLDKWLEDEILLNIAKENAVPESAFFVQNPESNLIFMTLSGKVSVNVEKDYYFLNFPSRMPVKAELPSNLEKSLSKKPQEVFKSRDFVLVYENLEDVKNIQIERNIFDTLNLGTGGVIITAQGDNVDFVSRFFTPRATLLEDPVTGSAHCSLIPYWAKKLNKEEMQAKQLSQRGGELLCHNRGDRVLIGGKARTYLK